MTPSGVVELDQTGSANGWVLCFGAAAQTDLLALHERWYKARLFADDAQNLSESIDAQPPISLFVMGANEWRGEQEWPLARTVWRPCYLQPDGSLRWSSPARTTTNTALSYRYDPRDPCPSVGAQFQAKTTAGPRDRNSPILASRTDVLVFETTPLAVGESLEVIGPIAAVLYVSSSCRDTDFTAALSVVTSEGSAAALCEGIARVRFRRRVLPVAPGEGSLDEHVLATIMNTDANDGDDDENNGSISRPHLMNDYPAWQESVYEITIDMWDTAFRFGAQASPCC
eukprot:SAG31_NODE_4194_length_3486_cov_1.765870_2_plen_285_part_00